MHQHQATQAQATRAVIDDLIEQVRTNGPAWLGVVRNAEGVARTLANVEAGLRAIGADDNGEAFSSYLSASRIKSQSITLSAEDIQDRIALAEQDLRGTRDTLGRLREKKQRMIANASDPAAKAEWVDRIEAGLVASEQASLADIKKYKEWLTIAPVVLTRG